MRWLNSTFAACLAVIVGSACASELDAPLASDTHSSTATADCHVRLSTIQTDEGIQPWTVTVRCPDLQPTSLEIVLEDYSGKKKLLSASAAPSQDLEVALDGLGSGQWTIHKIKFKGSNPRKGGALYPQIRVPNANDFTFLSDTEDTTGKLVVEYDFTESWPGAMDHIALGEVAAVYGGPFSTDGSAPKGVHETGLQLQGAPYHNASAKPSGWYGTLTRAFEVVPSGHGYFRISTRSFAFEISVQKTILSASRQPLSDH